MNVAPFRLVLAASLAVPCLCIYAAISSARDAPRARRTLNGMTGHRRDWHSMRCAARRGAAQRGGRTRRARRHMRCLSKRDSRGRRAAGRRRRQRARHPVDSRSPVHRTRAAANISTCTDADLIPNEEDVARVRTATLCLINRERVDDGEAPLALDAQLEQAAQGHSDEMVAAGYFEHVGPHGDRPVDRMRAAGYLNGSEVGYEVAEDIAWGTLWLATPRSIVAAWMASPGHRANILDPGFRSTGVGVSPHAPVSLADGQAGATYTQDFGAIFTR